MPKNRDKQRENKKKDKLNLYNELGFQDPTPYEAVYNINKITLEKYSDNIHK